MVKFNSILSKPFLEDVGPMEKQNREMMVKRQNIELDNI